MGSLQFLHSTLNRTVTDAVLQLSSRAQYDDYLMLLLLAVGGAGYLTRGSLWNKPDPYYYRWFERPQVVAGAGLQTKRETRNIAQKLEETQNDLVIFWGSQSGTAETFAHRLARDCHQRFRLKATVADVSDYDCESIGLIPPSKFAVFILSTYGEGDPSDNTADLWAWLRENTQTSLKNLRYMAFGLGNSNYKYYNRVVDVVVSKLNEFGATALMPVGKANDAIGATEEDYLAWKEEAFTMFRTSFGMTERQAEYEPSIRVVEDDSMTPIDLHLGTPVQPRTGRTTGGALSSIGTLPIKDSCELFAKTRLGRSCMHMELDLHQHPQIKYKTGDHVAVWPVNPNEEVARLARVLGLEAKLEMPISITSLDPANTKVSVPTPTSIRALFQHYLEICAPVSRETVLALAAFAPTTEAKCVLQTLGTDKQCYASFLETNHINLGRLLEHTGGSWSQLPLSFVVESLKPLSPRYYSISSSSVVTPRVLSLTAVVSLAPLPGNPSQCIPGLATNYLASLMGASTSTVGLTYPPLESGTQVHAHIRKSTFKLPANAATPIVMVAAGTGIAPFRAFLQERARLRSLDRAVGRCLLFFGCREPDEDFLYRSEIEEMQSTTLKDELRVVTAFSRVPGQPKTYVQDRVEEHAAEVCDLVLDQDATFYICGSAKMARDVTKRLGECIKTRSGWTDDELRNWSERQKRTHRWQEDVWG